MSEHDAKAFDAVRSLPADRFEPDGERPEELTIAVLEAAAQIAERLGFEVAGVVADRRGGVLAKLAYRGRFVEVGFENCGAELVVSWGRALDDVSPAVFGEWMAGIRDEIDGELS